jgi:hypothetical protein
MRSGSLVRIVSSARIEIHSAFESCSIDTVHNVDPGSNSVCLCFGERFGESLRHLKFVDNVRFMIHVSSQRWVDGTKSKATSIDSVWKMLRKRYGCSGFIAKVLLTI